MCITKVRRHPDESDLPGAYEIVIANKPVPVPVPEHKADVCLTPACVHAASELLYNLSPKYKELDPCDNFEELVCGGWRDRHDLRADQGDAFTGTIMSENSELLLRHILEAPYPKDSKVSSVAISILHSTTDMFSTHTFHPCSSWLLKSRLMKRISTK